MTSPGDSVHADYLWDPAAPPDPDVRDIETRLAPLAFDPARRPLALPAPARRSRVRLVLAGALAAGVLLAAGLGYYRWRLEWPAGQPWSVTARPADASQPAVSQQLAVGQTLDVAAPLVSAHVDVARLGTIDAAAGTRLTVASTTARRHRLEMTSGTVDVRLWAPPGTVAIHTPAGDVMDLGCIFELTVEGELARLSVRTGWVQLNNGYGESLIPAGASSAMTADRRPLVPVYDDAAPDFAEAVRALERADGSAVDPVATITREARPRDVLTVLLLAIREPPDARASLLARAAALAPPPDTVDLAAAAARDNDAIWRWIDSLPLPPVKSWWRNWRDALPRWQ